jgi:hypothetical protein
MLANRGESSVRFLVLLSCPCFVLRPFSRFFVLLYLDTTSQHRVEHNAQKK